MKVCILNLALYSINIMNCPNIYNFLFSQTVYMCFSLFRRGSDNTFPVSFCFFVLFFVFNAGRDDRHQLLPSFVRHWRLSSATEPTQKKNLRTPAAVSRARAGETINSAGSFDLRSAERAQGARGEAREREREKHFHSDDWYASNNNRNANNADAIIGMWATATRREEQFPHYFFQLNNNNNNAHKSYVCSRYFASPAGKSRGTSTFFFKMENEK